MLKRLLKSLKRGEINPIATQVPVTASAVTISRDEHTISRKQISKNALNVMYELTRAGYQAYLVGGGVRDLLLGLSPKDFDVATDATPEQVKQHFRRARIVGRRFRIVHVRFGREIIEVTTFRGSHDQTDDSKINRNDKTQVNDQGMLLRDNVYGSLHDDAMRRDFTINALYYSIDGFTVLDHTNGMQDLADKKIRIIGDAGQRYAEDPVRMLRAIRFQAKFDFSLETATAKPIAQLAPLLKQISAPRLFDEVLKLFLSGTGKKTYQLMDDYGLFAPLFPATGKLLSDQNEASEHFHSLILSALENTDLRVKQDKPVTPAFLYAALLWPRVLVISEQYQQQGEARFRALQLAGHQAVDEQMPVIAIPKRFSIPMREIWTLQHRLETAHGKRAIGVLQHPRFRAAYDFLLLREQSSQQAEPRGPFWTELQIQHPINKDHTESDRPRRRRRSRKPRPKGPRDSATKD
ncbi:MAG TPA: polynucleotide adenylyltransferase PcnB [Cellvibrionales bacterium]|jgi:poly(A) polymerase|nr:polynucleotide adenylyltransferase PcnB [Cellvibrionales bacterium]